MPSDGGSVGTQPVRVLDYNILQWFETKYPEFRIELEDIGKRFGLKRTLKYFCDEAPMRDNKGRYLTAYVNGEGQVAIHETFLSYVWALSYAFLIIFDEKIHGPHIGKKPGHGKALEYFLPKGYAALDYALGLITKFSRWPLDLPSPETYHSEDGYYVERANGIYLAAVDFILCHEVGHLAQGHLEKLKQARRRGGNIKLRERKRFEREADNWALAHVSKGVRLPERTLTTVGFGPVVGLGSLLFLDRDLTSATHPDKDDRIRSVLLGLPLDDRDSLWGIAAGFYAAWDWRFSVGLDISGEYKTYASLVRRIESQLSSRKRKGQKKDEDRLGLD